MKDLLRFIPMCSAQLAAAGLPNDSPENNVKAGRFSMLGGPFSLSLEDLTFLKAEFESITMMVRLSLLNQKSWLIER